MPDWLVKLLQDNDGKLVTTNQVDKDGKTRRSKKSPNMAADIVPVIAHLLDLDPNVAYAYVCDSAVKHVSKLMKEGMLTYVSAIAKTDQGPWCRWLLWVQEHSNDQLLHRRSTSTRSRHS